MAQPAPDFVEAVLEVVASIPEGMAMSYGDVAAAIGSRAARGVGQVMAYYGERGAVVAGGARIGPRRRATTRAGLSSTTAPRARRCCGPATATASASICDAARYEPVFQEPA